MTDCLWTHEELAEALSVQPHLAASPPGVCGISIDTRTIRPGELFIALKGNPGPRFKTLSPGTGDGHDYVEAAAREGAAAAVVHRQQPVSLPQYCVADTLDGLWALGRSGRRRNRGRILALTGSSGKTTLKHFLATLTGGYASAGSQNNFWGVPLALARLPAGLSPGIFELGMNSPGEIAPLARLVKSHVAMILNVLPVHQAQFSDLDEIVKEKFSIASGLERGGTLVFPERLRGAAQASWSGRCLTFGITADANVRLLDTHDARRMAFRVNGQLLEAGVNFRGTHRRMTAAAAVAGCVALGEEPRTIVERLPLLSLPEGRGNHVTICDITIIDDSYNANPASMAAALADLAAMDARRRYAILGEMLELGIRSPDYHRNLAAACVGLGGVWLVGKEMLALADRLPKPVVQGWQEKADAALSQEVAERLNPGDCLLVKGSNGVFWKTSFMVGLKAACGKRG